MKARVTPEHKLRNKAYHCIFTGNEEDETIESIKCDGSAANLGGCKHVVAFLMWLHRRSKEPATTYVRSYWTKSKLSAVGTTQKFIKSSDLTKGRVDAL